jgi:hypothetical protein
MLRYIHLGAGYRLLVFLMNLNCFMQLLCVGVVMGKSEDLVDLIGNFVGEESTAAMIYIFLTPNFLILFSIPVYVLYYMMLSIIPTRCGHCASN